VVSDSRYCLGAVMNRRGGATFLRIRGKNRVAVMTYTFENAES